MRAERSALAPAQQVVLWWKDDGCELASRLRIVEAQLALHQHEVSKESGFNEATLRGNAATSVVPGEHCDAVPCAGVDAKRCLNQPRADLFPDQVWSQAPADIDGIVARFHSWHAGIGRRSRRIQ
jgi:hypothetical protein